MRLCVNIDHVATLRNARGEDSPDPVEAALTVEQAGADGIVCHLREDRRHIRDEDVKRLRKTIATKLDLEMSATPGIIAVALRVKPDLVTLVPEKRRELTTEGGLDVRQFKTSLALAIRKFHDRGIPVSLFIDPEKTQIESSIEIGADMIELHTGEYAAVRSAAEGRKQLQRITTMASFAKKMGLIVNAGHGLDYDNIRAIARNTDIEEVSIGYAVIVRALEVGLGNAVREMVKLVKRG